MSEHEIALQLLRPAEKVKAKNFNFNDILSNSEVIINRLQSLKNLYREVLLIDLDYALRIKLDEDLWKYGFANYIEPLYERVKRTTCLLDPELVELKALLVPALAEAKRFYCILLEEFRVTFDLDLEIWSEEDGNPFMDAIPKRTIHHRPKESSLLYICQQIYIHLGDISKYRGNFDSATTFYRYATRVGPVSATYGKVFNQIGLLNLEGNSSWNFLLTAVYFFTRGSGVSNPSQVAIRNLFRTLATCAKGGSTKINKYVDELQDVNKRRKVLTPEECLALFLKVHGLIHTGSKDLAACVKIIPWLIRSWEAWATERAKESHEEVVDNFCRGEPEAFCRMFLIDLFALHKIQKRSKSKVDAAQPDEADQRAKAIILDLIAGSLHAALQPISRIQRDDIPRYFALPFVKLALDWIRSQPDVMTEPAFTTRPRIWTNICAILRALQKEVSKPDFAKLYPAVPLPEDHSLHGFVPFKAAISNEIQFGENEVIIQSISDLLLRCELTYSFLDYLDTFEDIYEDTIKVLLSEPTEERVASFLLNVSFFNANKMASVCVDRILRRERNGELAFVDGTAAIMPVPACCDLSRIAGAKSKKNKKKKTYE